MTGCLGTRLDRWREVCTAAFAFGAFGETPDVLEMVLDDLGIDLSQEDTGAMTLTCLGWQVVLVERMVCSERCQVGRMF